MMHLIRVSKNRLTLFLTTLALTACLTSCMKAESRSAPEANKKTFASPQEAGAALLQAAQSGDPAALLAIFGPDGKDVLFTGDSEIDKNALKDFAEAYAMMNRWGKIDAGGEMLYVGAENFPFPIPLQKNSAGRWYFNIAAGADEVQARRIGKDELVAVAALQAIANAEQQYFNQPQGGQVRQYAQKFVSDQGKHDGLYWPASKGQNESPLGQMGDFAKGAGYTNPGEKPQPFSGYFFRIITKQGDSAQGGAKDYIVDGKMTGGFAIMAYPSDYRDSGIMTFVVGTDGVVYQKDLGNNTVDTAQATTEYNPGDGWEKTGE